MRIYLVFISVLGILFTSCNSKSSAVFPSVSMKEGLVISELMANNDTLEFDVQGQTPDWIELYNSSDSPIDLSEFYISDDAENPLKAQLTGQLLPDSHAVFYASGIDTLKNHLSFKLNNEGEVISLYSNGEQLADKVSYPLMPKNSSYAFIGNHWSYVSDWSPGKPNKVQLEYYSLSQNVNVDYTITSDGVLASFSAHLADGFEYKILERDQPESEYKLYKKPFLISAGQVIKVKSTGKHILDHKSFISAYVPSEKHTLPVVSLVTEPPNLWDKKRGLYTKNNAGFKEKIWQRPALVSVFSEDTILNHAVDFKIFGNASRTLPKKSISFKSKTEIENIMFSRNSAEVIDGFLVRACHTGMTMYRNEFMNDLNQSINGHLRMQEYVPSVLYINGEYWGVYNIMERKNDEFIRNHIGYKATHMINANDKQIKPAKGNVNEFIEVIENLNKITNQEELYTAIETNFRMEEFIDFWAHELFIGRVDTYNNRFWKSELAPDKRWGVITFDYDIIFGRANSSKLFDKYFFSESNTGLKFFNSLIRSKKFKDQLVYRICELMNTAYIPSRVEKIIGSYEELTFTEFLADTARWNAENDRSRISQPSHAKTQYSKFSIKRKDYIHDSILHRIGYSKKVELLIPEDFPGTVLVNGLEAEGTIIFYTEMKFMVEVIPDNGVKFKGWSNGTDNYTKEEFQFSKPISLTLDYELSN